MVLLKYKKLLEYYIDKQYNTEIETETGSGMQHKRQSYKLTNDGKYGDLIIDVNKLLGYNNLVAMKGTDVIINQKVDDDFIELITKRYNTKKTYSKESEKLFKELTEMSGLPFHKTSSKFKKILNNNDIEFYNDPTELLNELEIIIGSIKSGNKSPLLLNKGISIIDELIQKGYIKQEDHEKLYNKLI